MRRFVSGMLTGWFVLGIALLAQRLASEKTISPEIIVDNEKVKVVRWKLQPGEGSPLHTHSLDHVYVVVHGSKIREVTSEGKVSDDEQETGRAAFSPARGKTHSFANIGKGPYEMVSVELKK